MKNFKLHRTGSLVLGLWLLASSLYVIISGFEKFDCCALNVEGYGVYTLIQWLIDAKNAQFIDCHCDLKNVTNTFFIIPIDLMVGSLSFVGVFGYLQYNSKIKPQKSK